MLVTSFIADPFAAKLAVPFCIFCYLLYLLKKRTPEPHIYIANIELFNPDVSSGFEWKERLYFLPYLFKWIALGALVVAFLNFSFHVERKQPDPSKIPPQENLSTEGIAIYLVLDQSGSMAEKITARRPGEGFETISKIDLVKRVTKLFITGDSSQGLPGRPNDLIGLVEFARTARVIVPLTLERKELLQNLANFHTIGNPEQDGTAIGYAILKTSRLIVATRNYARDLMGKGKPAYEIQNSIIILVTDGMQDPNPADKNSRWRQIDPREAAAYSKEQGIAVYIVNVEPTFSTEEFAANRRQMQQTAEMTGGKFFMVNSGESLGKIYASIDVLEKSKLPFDPDLAELLKQKLSKEKLPGLYDTYYLSNYFVGLALIALFLGIVLESTLLRRVP